MLRTRIIINNQEIDLSKDVDFVINYQISDIRNPDQKKTDTTYSVQINGTKTNNKIFSHIFEISKEILSSDLSVNYTPDFNPNLKTDSKIYVDNVQVFSGYAKLEEVQNVKGIITYVLSFKGVLGSIFSKIKGKKLTDLDLQSKLVRFSNSYSQHQYRDKLKVNYSNYDNINTYSCNIAVQQIGQNQIVSGYTYYTLPLIDKGNEIEAEFELNEINPAWSLSSYVNAIIDEAGYKVNPNSFLKKNFFNSFYIPFLSDNKLSESEKTNRSIYLGSYNQTLTTIFDKYNKVNPPQYLEGTLITDRRVYIPSDYSAPFFDSTSQFDQTSGLITINKTGNYNFNFNLNLTLPSSFLINGVNCKFTPNTTQGTGLSVRLCRYKNTISGQLNGTIVSETTINLTGNNYNGQLNVPNLRCESGEQYFFIYYLNLRGDVQRIDNNQIVIGNKGKNYSYNLTNTTFNVTPVSTTIYSGDTYDLNAYIPNDVLQSDFLLSTFKLFNLQIDIDKNDETSKTLIIQTFNDFYDTENIIDWNNKLDTSKPINFKPISEIDSKSYTFSYKEDDDYYSSAYKKIYNENYGQKIIDVENDFVNQNKKIEVIFSPCLPVKFITSNLIAPKIYDADENGNITRREKNNIRLIYKPYYYYYPDALSNKQLGSHTIIERTKDNVIVKRFPLTYNFFGHTDKPTNPTVDTMFGTPKQVFWSGVGKYTNNNLYNQFYKQYIDTITSKDSKLLKCFINLKPIDIYNFSFRNIVQVMGQNFRVNKIINYNPLNDNSTEVELFKLIDAPVFLSSEINLENETAVVGDKYIIDAGIDTVRSPLATSPYNLINCGLDEVRGFGSMSTTNLIDGGQDVV